jgi:preprotein translocase subunit SecF
MQIIKPDININFIGYRKPAFIFSAVLILASIVTLVLHGGPRYGIDFAGGAEALARFHEPVTIDRVKAALQASEINGTVQQYGDDEPMFRILIAADQADAENLDTRLQKGLAQHTQTGVTLESFEMVGPQVGRDMREKALLAMFFALLFITVYISGRFELKWLVSAGMAAALGFSVYVLRLIHLNIPALMVAALLVSLALFYLLNLRYAMGAIVALLHDVLITIGVFSIFGKEFTLPIIAALLTIIGYSLNDTIIVFDRIRENLRKYHKRPQAEIINRSINETLSRTILTSGTTLLVVFVLFLLGGGIIHDFSFALLVGIGVGTYSSIFVASPVLLAWQKKKAAA